MSQLTEDRVLGIMQKYGNDRQQLNAILLDVQNASGQNYVDRKWATLISGKTDIPLAKIYEILTFYSMFSIAPRGRFLVEVCKSTPCEFDRGQQVVAWFESALGIKVDETTADGMFTLTRTSCVGACDIGPVAKIGDEVYGNLTYDKVCAIIASCRENGAGCTEEAVCQN